MLSNRAKVLDLTILTRSIRMTTKQRTGKTLLDYLFLVTTALLFLGTVIYLLAANANAASLVAVDGNIFSAVWKLVSGWGGLEYTVKINAIMTILISSMKVSFLKPLWDKIKDIKITYKGVVQHINAQTYFVLFLHIIVGIITQGNFTLPAILAYVFIGGGSVYFHELADGLKNIPIIGDVLKWIEVIAKYVLKAPVEVKK